MIAALFAVDEAGGMGNNGIMPWPRNKDDMMWFKRTTQDQIVMMGKRTWESDDMPTPLPGRTNVLVTNNFMHRDDILQFRGNVCEAIRHLSNKNPELNIFVIGGPTLLMQALPVIERAFITRIPGEYMCDAKIDLNQFLHGFMLSNTTNLGTCYVEEFTNEAI